MLQVALTASCCGLLSPSRFSGTARPAAAVQRSAALHMEVDSDTRPQEMIFADADKAFKMLDKDQGGTVDSAELKDFLVKKEYDDTFITKIFSSIDVDASNQIEQDEL